MTSTMIGRHEEETRTLPGDQPNNSRNFEMRRVTACAKDLCVTKFPILLRGEPGVGKQHLAQWMHVKSRRPGAFVSLQCSNVDELTAFLGVRSQSGKHVSRGTLFVRDVHSVPPALQGRLQQILAEHRETSTIVAATTLSLARMAEEGSFDSDLFLMLATHRLTLPPLRDRPEDIISLTSETLWRLAEQHPHKEPRMDPGTIALFLRHSWPENIRELLATISKAVLASPTGEITANDFPNLQELVRQKRPYPKRQRSFFEALSQFERRYLVDLLEQTAGNISQASRISGLSRAAVRNKAYAYDLIEKKNGKVDRPRSRVRLR